MLFHDTRWHIRAQASEPLTVGPNLSGSAVYVMLFQQHFANSLPSEIYDAP